MSQERPSAIRLVVDRGESKGRTFTLEEGENVIGRWDPDAGAFPEIDLSREDVEAQISRKHAIIFRRGQNIEVEDLGSLNGTFINRGPRLEHNKRFTLRHGDELVVGKVFLKVEFAEPDERLPH